MSLSVSIDLPADLERRLRLENPDLDMDVKEIYVLELFRRGRISHFDLSRSLGLDRFETDAYLRRLHVFENSLTLADLEADRQTLGRLMAKAR